MQFLSLLPEWAQMLTSAMGALVLLATVIVRMIPGSKDDLMVDKVEGYWRKAIMFLPTLGMNPKTKKLMEAIDELKSSMPKKEK